ncbi:hypothetical protein D1J36_002530 [Riemerella anatipestifer]|uniref:hypothetical protein n=1 Tax=Riemerella anatipestifer TaxID=34085 RepID=UPI0012AE339F|nr:hypothetical protein [Riemerella anatipestifer]USL96005.1 hypothetical protein D1J36_002530 [Riemerella anatipestifer]
MKKLIFTCLVSCVLLVSCRQDKGFVDKDEFQTNSALISKQVSFSDFSKTKTILEESGIISENGMGAGFEFVLGRKSRDCHGFGICEVTMIWIDIWNSKDTLKSNGTTNTFKGVIVKNKNIQSENINNFKNDDRIYTGYVILDDKIQIEGFDTTLYVDEDINVNNKYIIKSGAYPMIKKLGDYGGYELRIEKL